jgi:hypothetical protein
MKNDWEPGGKKVSKKASRNKRSTGMNRNKFLSVFLAVVMLAAIPASVAFAAPGTSTLGTGTIQSISIDTTATPTTVIVTLLDGAGLAQKVTISLETAVEMGLVTPATVTPVPGGILTFPGNLTGIVSTDVLVTDPVTGISSLTVTLTDATTVSLNLSDALALGLISTTVNSAMIGTASVIDPTLILASTTYTKVVSMLGNYFGATLGVTFDQFAAYQAAGFGYGVISQAAWMASQLGGTVTLDQILTAKSTGDYSGLVLPGGVTVTNWGQLRKLVLTDPHQNLGQIMSGKAAPLPAVTTATTTTTVSTASKGNGNSNGNANSTGNSSTTGNSSSTGSSISNSTGNGNGNSNGNGNGNSNGNGNGPKK